MNDIFPPRDLFGPGQSGAIQDLLQSIFVAELLQPSRMLWMAFGWISDVEILDNRARQFGALQPDWPASTIRLSQVLQTLVERGANIALVLRNVDHNHQFIARLETTRQRFPASMRYALGDDVHKKGILGDDFLLNGSMNLTFNGVTVNDEHLTLRTDSASIEEWRLVMEQNWEASLK